ncbi:hypothetical protein, partial [Enterococcus faecalis]|uniref:hypothetical protein n=1 Tax=Enterococcus faecalis TaxID=1351 RepID=UPI003CC55D85
TNSAISSVVKAIVLGIIIVRLQLLFLLELTDFSVLYSYYKFIIVISDYLLEVVIQSITTLNCTNVVNSFFGH